MHNRDAHGASRRRFLAVSGAGSLGAALTVPAVMGRLGDGANVSNDGSHNAAHGMGGLGTVGDVTLDQYYDPIRYLTTWNEARVPGSIAPCAGWADGEFYRETMRDDGTRLREYQFVATDKEIEIAPGLYFPAWTYNNQVPGPTIRATQGDRIRIRFVNQGSHPHTMHFHGWHTHDMDGSFPDQFVEPNDEFIYEFDADPVGLHLYHCHSVPLKRHIHKGLYGAFIVDPDPRTPGLTEQEQAVAKTRNPDCAENRDVRELIMMMNAFDTDFDADNEVYAVNTIAFHYMRYPIQVRVGQLVRVYLVNITEFDLINSFHLHAGFFDVFRTGTKLTTSEFTDTIMLCQAERAILEFKLRWPGQYMFHAHQSEFAELGWMGAFEAVDGSEVIASSDKSWNSYSVPAFELPDSNGLRVGPHSYLNRSHLLLVFSRGGRCGHCLEQAQALERYVQAFKSRDTEILFITPSNEGFGSIPIRHAADVTRDVFRRYGVFETNRPGHGTFLVDKAGQVRWQDIGTAPFTNNERLLAEVDRLNAIGWLGGKGSVRD